MPKITVKKCTRPQCQEVYSEKENNKYCICGALLQVVDIEIKNQKNNAKINNPNPPQKKVLKGTKSENVSKKNEEVTEEDSCAKGFLYLLLDDDEIEYELSEINRIGRTTEDTQADIDLTEYAGKDVSRQHAVITKENDGFYITNVSKTHSVRIIDKDNNEMAMEYGNKIRLESEVGILLSKKVFLQFVEEKNGVGKKDIRE